MEEVTKIDDENLEVKNTQENIEIVSKSYLLERKDFFTKKIEEIDSKLALFQ